MWLVILAGPILAAPSPAGAQVFVDVTSGPLGDPGTGYGVAWGDYDNDGDLDLYFARENEPNILLRNEGGDTFVDVAGGTPLGDTGYGHGVAWGDYDNDGDLDLYLVKVAEANRLFRNEGAGSFVDATGGAPLANSGLGQGVAWGDYDNDGDLDLYVANVATSNRLFRNEGDGSFSDATVATGTGGGSGYSNGVAWGDYDNDGDLDLFVANLLNGSRLFRNEGAGGFTDVKGGTVLPDTAVAVAWGDYDNDGDLDLYLSGSLMKANRLFRNEGGGSFADVTGGSPIDGTIDGAGAAWGDYDNDGDLDLYLSTAAGNKLVRNEGGGAFADVTAGTPLEGDPNTVNVAWGDYDGDGDLDIYLVNYGQANKLIRNDTANGNHWLHVDLEGTVSNRSGIGARVRVVAGGVSRMEEVSGGAGWGSQNSLTAEFGLGATSTIDSVVVSWPSGIVQAVVPAPASNQRILVVESAGPTAVGDPSGGRTPGFALMPARPNPFARGTTLGFTLPRTAAVRLEVLDMAGRVVRRLLEGTLPAGRHQVAWDGADAAGRPLGAGVYLCLLRAESDAASRRVVLMP